MLDMKPLILLPLLAAPLLAMAAPDPDAAPHGTTRAEVREALHQARITGRMSPGGELADRPEVLQAREDFNALQAEVLNAERQAERDALAERD